MPDSSVVAGYARLLRLTPVEGLSPTQTLGALARANDVDIAQIAKAPRKWRWPRGLTSFLVLAVLPACVAVLYFFFFAADRYESEARFVLRTPGRTLPTSQVSNLLQSTGVARSNDDGYVVREFLKSRDATEYLEKNAALRASLVPAERDPLWQFPNLFSPNTNEGLYWHFQRLMSATFDSNTGVSTLSVQAFAPDDAQRLAMGLLTAAEVLVNRLNERAQRDAVALADKEADRMRERALLAQSAITSFREQQRIVDPSHSTLALLEAIGKLSLESAGVSVQLNELERGSPNSPQIQVLRTRRTALEAQISLERQRLAGDSSAIAPRIAEYERLMLEREFAERALIAAMTSVEMARLEAVRQQVYLERVALPALSDYPAYPWAYIWTFAIFGMGCMAWRLWRSLVGDILEHTK